MSEKAKKFALIIVLGIVFMLAGEWNSAGERQIPSASLGKPVAYIYESEWPQLSIDQIACDGKRLYILFDRGRGIVQVYDLDGNYLNSISFYCARNGAFKIAAVSETFYVQDKRGNLYLFRDGEFVDFVENQDNKELRRSIDFEINAPDYEVRWESVWRITETEAMCILKRPLTAFLNQRNQFFIGIGMIILAALFYIKTKKVGTTK